MNDRPTFKAAVIGGGVIGALMDTPGALPPLTHAGAYLAHPGFDLCAICEPQPAEPLRAWPCALYQDIDEMLAQVQPEIVSVAVPKEQQPAILEKLAGHALRAVIAEKPLAPTLPQARGLAKKFEDAHIPLLVNLPRRYSLMYRDMAARFSSGAEKVLSAQIYYAKGLLHNGIHAIDLARLLFGEILEATPLAAWPDFFADDPSVSAFLRMAHCRQLYLQALDERAFTLFEVDIVTDKARYIVTNDHRTLHVGAVAAHAGVPAGNRLVPQESRATDYADYFMRLMDNAYDVAHGSSSALCDARVAIAAHAVIEDIRARAREKSLV